MRDTRRPLPIEDRPRLTMLYAERIATLDIARPGSVDGYARLTERLCRPGELVVPPRDIDLTAEFALLAERGRFARGRARMMAGEPSQCHANVSELWWGEAIDQIVTGYGLGPGDGLWRPHTFGLQRPGPGQPVAVVETTVVRDAYFGVPLTGLCAVMFVLANGDEVAAVVPSASRQAELAAAMDEIEHLVSTEPALRQGGIADLLVRAEAGGDDEARTWGLYQTRP